MSVEALEFLVGHGYLLLFGLVLNEATSARVALRLRRVGVMRVRPLAGGFEGWRAGGFPVEPVPTAADRAAA